MESDISETSNKRKRKRKAEVVIELPRWQGFEVNAEAGPSHPLPNHEIPILSDRDDVEVQNQSEEYDGEGLDWYLDHLDTHIQESHQSVLGNSLSLWNPGSTSLKHLQPTTVPPSGALWSWDEKSAFFAGLARHSRLRPDLIAQEILTKSEHEVVWYMNLLESCSKAVKLGQDDDEMDAFGEEYFVYPTGNEVLNSRKQKRRERKIRSTRWGGSYIWREGYAPAAREVSEKWIKKEEVLSELVERDYQAAEEEKQRILKAKDRRRERRRWKNISSELLMGEEEQQSDIKQEYPTNYARIKYARPEGLERMAHQWKVEDWGEDIGYTKLEQLNRLMRPMWADWYSKRIISKREPGEPTSSLPIPNAQIAHPYSRSETPHLHTALSVSPTRKAKADVIISENQELDLLSAIPQSRRTSAEKKRFRVLTNKKRNREKYRYNKLILEGMTPEDIAVQGGADIIMTERAEKALNEKAIDSEKKNKRNWTNRAHDNTVSKTEIIEPTKSDPSQQAVTSVEGNATSPTGQDDASGRNGDHNEKRIKDLWPLRQLGVDDMIMEKGWEIFNYEGLSELLHSFHSDDPVTQEEESCVASVSLVEPTITFNILQGLHEQLMIFVKRLVYHSIILGEQRSAQLGPNGEHSKRVGTPSNRSRLGETEEYLNGNHNPNTTQNNTEESFNHIEKCDVDLAMALQGIQSAEESPPSGIPWYRLPCAHPPRTNQTNQEQIDEPVNSSINVKEEELADEEDEKLETALEVMDRAQDKILENALWNAVSGTGGEDVIGDLESSWMGEQARLGRQTVVGNQGRSVISEGIEMELDAVEEEKGEEDEDEDAEGEGEGDGNEDSGKQSTAGQDPEKSPSVKARFAQASYTKCLNEINKARRIRQNLSDRAYRFSKARMMKLGRSGKSVAIIEEDSDTVIESDSWSGSESEANSSEEESYVEEWSGGDSDLGSSRSEGEMSGTSENEKDVGEE